MCAGVSSGGRFRRVPVCAGVSSGGRFRKVPEDSDVCWCRFRRQVPKVPEGSGGEFQGFGRFRSGFLPCNLDRNSHVIVLNTFW